MDWRVIALLIIGLVGIFGYMDVKVSAKVLGVLMIFEILILLIFDIAVFAQTDANNFSGMASCLLRYSLLVLGWH